MCSLALIGSIKSRMHERKRRYSLEVVGLFIRLKIGFIFQEDIAEIFKVADKDNSGTLTMEEFQDVIEDVVIRYPQVELYLRSKHLMEVSDLLKDFCGNEQQEVDIEGFKLALSLVDKQTKSLPATAQVCSASLLEYQYLLFFTDRQINKYRLFNTRLLLNKVHISQGALMLGKNVYRIQRGLVSSEVVVVMSFALSGSNPFLFGSAS